MFSRPPSSPALGEADLGDAPRDLAPHFDGLVRQQAAGGFDGVFQHLRSQHGDTYLHGALRAALHSSVLIAAACGKQHSAGEDG